jgi:hypothetical protein
MNETLLFLVAVFVFVMMSIGLFLTVLEFRYGQPRRESNEENVANRSTTTHRTRVATWVQSR